MKDGLGTGTEEIYVYEGSIFRMVSSGTYLNRSSIRKLNF